MLERKDGKVSRPSEEMLSTVRSVIDSGGLPAIPPLAATAITRSLISERHRGFNYVFVMPNAMMAVLQNPPRHFHSLLIAEK